MVISDSPKKDSRESDLQVMEEKEDVEILGGTSLKVYTPVKILFMYSLIVWMHGPAHTNYIPLLTQGLCCFIV